MLKVLHTSDWHLGRRLYGKSRHIEFQSFLDWLLIEIHKNQIDVLVVAGDVFDTSTPNNQTQSLYYNFLTKVSETCCRHVVIVAGNHDSPSFLDAPKYLLKTLNIHIIGSITDNICDEILILQDNKGNPELIVIAVPYLRDRDVRQFGVGERLDDKENQLLLGIKNHYQTVTQLAVNQQKLIKKQYGYHVPIIATGHLFVSGGQAGEGVRDLYVGTLAHVSTNIFAESLDYVALGHLHIPQKVTGNLPIYYSGSPIAMGFAEAKQQKQVNVISFCVNESNIQTNIDVQVKKILVPTFQQLLTIKGDWENIANQLEQLKQQNESVWLEIIYDGQQIMGDLRDKILEKTKNSKLEVLKLKNQRIHQQTLKKTYEGEHLDELNEQQVFTKCLQAHQVLENEQQILWQKYHEILMLLQEKNN